MFEGLREISTVCSECFRGISRKFPVFLRSYKGCSVFDIFVQRGYKVFSENFQGISGKFLGGFKKVSRVI